MKHTHGSLIILVGVSIVLTVMLLTVSAEADTVPALRAYDFHHSIAINTHFNYNASAYYDNYGEVKSLLLELDIRHIRDQIASYDAARALIRDLGDNGIESCLIVTSKNSDGTLKLSGIDNQLSIIKNYGLLSSLDGIMSANEYDLNHPSVETDWAGTQRDYHIELWEQVSTDSAFNGIPLVGPGLAHGNSVDNLGDLSDYADVGDCHTYHNSNGGVCPEDPANNHFINYLNNAPGTYGNKPLWISEVGYNDYDDTMNTYATYDVQARYLTRSLAYNYRMGIDRTYLYELVGGFGIVRQAGSDDSFTVSKKVKPFNAVKGLIAKIRDTASGASTFTPESVNVEYTDKWSSTYDLLLQKKDGTYMLLLWRGVESIPDGTDRPSNMITVKLPDRQMKTAKLYYMDENNNYLYSQVSPTITNGNQVRIGISDKVSILEFTTNIQSGSYYTLENMESSPNLLDSDGTTVDCNHALVRADTKWKIVYRENGWFTLENEDSSPNLLDSDGDAVDCNHSLVRDDTKWKIIHRGDGWYTLESKTNSPKFLDADGDMVDCNNPQIREDTKWKLIKR